MTQIRGTRRDVFRLGGGALALTAFIGPSGTMPADQIANQIASQIARGTVFEDRSGTGLLQPGDPGIAGVLVSNGREIVKTDASGHFELPVEDGSAVFIIKPAGWSTPLESGTNLPRFYRLHQPEGSPVALGLRYPGVEPTGRLPDHFDFPLRRSPESARFDVLMLADPQPANLAELDYFRESFVDALAGADAAFGLTLGDVMADNFDLYDRYNRLIAQTDRPWWNLPGNHDLNYEADDRRYARETWKRVFGPPYYAFEYGAATFVMLDNVDWRRSPSGKAAYSGCIGEAQLDFVRNLLAHTPEERLIIVCMHIPLICSDSGEPGSNTSDAAELLALLGNRPALSFSGHMHTCEHHYPIRAGASQPHHHQVLAAVSGSWWSGPFGIDGLPLAQCSDGAPNGYYVLSVDGAIASTRFVSRETTSFRIMLDSPGEQSSKSTSPCGATCLTRGTERTTCVIVNVFDGGPRCEVTLNIAASVPIIMQRVRQPDPFTKDIYARNSGALKSWVAAGDSSHLWSAQLPDLPPGYHKLKVDVRDEFGRRRSQMLVVEIKLA